MSQSPETTGKLEIPDWFEAQNAVQESIVDQEIQTDRALDNLMQERVSAAKRSALPKATEHIREMYSRAKCMRRGRCQVWTSEAWQRVQENECRKEAAATVPGGPIPSGTGAR